MPAAAAADRGQVGLGDLVAGPADQRAPRRSDRNPRQRPEPGDALLDLGVGGRDDLAPVAQVELVPVVGGRIVARGDHDPGRHAQVPDRERQQGSGAGPRQHVHRDARPRQHPRRLVRELRRPVPRVTPHHHPDPAAPSRPDPAAREQPARHGGGRRPDHGAVHPVRPRRDHPAQPRRPEVQPVREPVPQLPTRRTRRPASGPPPPLRRRTPAPVEQRLQLGPVARVRVIRDPGLGRRPQLSLTRHLPHTPRSALI